MDKALSVYDWFPVKVNKPAESVKGRQALLAVTSAAGFTALLTITPSIRPAE